MKNFINVDQEGNIMSVVEVGDENAIVDGLVEITHEEKEKIKTANFKYDHKKKKLVATKDKKKNEIV